MVHILHHGLPLCLFCDKPTPAEWPPGHKWVAISDQDIEAHVDCRECKEQLEKLRTKKD